MVPVAAPVIMMTGILLIIIGDMILSTADIMAGAWAGVIPVSIQATMDIMAGAGLYMAGEGLAGVGVAMVGEAMASATVAMAMEDITVVFMTMDMRTGMPAMQSFINPVAEPDSDQLHQPGLGRHRQTGQVLRSMALHPAHPAAATRVPAKGHTRLHKASNTALKAARGVHSNIMERHSTAAASSSTASHLSPEEATQVSHAHTVVAAEAIAAAEAGVIVVAEAGDTVAAVADTAAAVVTVEGAKKSIRI